MRGLEIAQPSAGLIKAYAELQLGEIGEVGVPRAALGRGEEP